MRALILATLATATLLWPQAREGTLKVGDPAPDFRLKVYGSSDYAVLSDLRRSKPVVLVFGSFTEPAFRAKAGMINVLNSEWSKKVEFVWVYIRESHASDGAQVEANTLSGIVLPTPKRIEERESYVKLSQSYMRIRFTTLIDSMDDFTESVYAAWPLRLFLVDTQGRLAYVGRPDVAGFELGELGKAIDYLLFLDRLYLDLFNREPETAELTHWLEELGKGSISKPQLAYELFKSPEFQDNGLFVISTYLAAVGHNPDLTGWQRLMSGLQSHVPKATLVDGFLQSDEFKHAYGSLDDPGYVKSACVNLLGREPDADGLNYWVTQLKSGKDTRTTLLYTFIISDEYQTRVRSRALTTLLYMAFLRRPPQDKEFDYWNAQLERGTTVLNAITALISTPEYQER